MSTEKEIKDAAVRDTVKEFAKDTAKDAKTSPWDLDSGLPDKVTGTITNAYWGKKAEYQGGEQTLLILTIEGQDYDPFEIVLSPGTGWEPTDEGRAIKSTKGKTHIIRSSVYGKFIDRVVNELKVPMPKESSPLLAESWLGLHPFYFEREELDFGKGIMSERGGKSTHLMPVSYLSDADISTTAKSAAPSPNPELKQKLVELAKVNKTHTAFFQQVTRDFPTIGQDQTLLRLILEDGPLGLYGAQHPELFITK
jgi:hypothetical protein